MRKQDIPTHELQPSEFFLMERIEGASPDSFNRLHRHNFYEILWFTASKHDEWHSIDFEKHPVSANDIYILSPGQVHTMEVGSKKGFLIPIATDFFESLFGTNQQLLSFPYFFCASLPEDLSVILLKLVDLIQMEFDGHCRRNLLEAYMTAFFIHLRPLQQEVRGHSLKEEKIQLILKLIDLHFADEREVSFYAQAANLSIRRINELVVEATGQTVKQHLINRLMTEAKRNVAKGSKSYKEIAYDLGFNDPAYFSRFFKSKTGLSPEEFRTIASSTQIQTGF